MKSRGFLGGKRSPPGDSGGVPPGDPLYQTPIATNHTVRFSTEKNPQLLMPVGALCQNLENMALIPGGSWVVQSCCTERSTHTCARVPADLAQAPDGEGKVGGGSGEGFYEVLHRET
jgi:hypothetical protein